MGTRAVQIVEPGMRTTVQDLGRPGHAAIGVSPSGAADRGALRLANRLVGNDDAAPALEVTGGGLVLVARASCRVAVSGAPRDLRVEDAGRAMHAPFELLAGMRLHLGHGRRGLYTYVAFDGGVDVARVLGSASSDVLGGIGPAPLAAGDEVRLGTPAGPPPGVDVAPVQALSDAVELRVLPGPRVDRFVPDALDALCSRTWRVGPATNRVATRLVGEPIALAVLEPLPSEGIVRGAVQVPPDGQPVVFGPDHPTTGGYPVLAVVVDADLDAAAQATPGSTVRFRRAT